MIILIVLATVIAIVLLCKYIDYKCCGFDKNEPNIKFKTFQNLYITAPDKWDLYEAHVSYDGEWICFSNFIDYLKYKKFHSEIEKNDIQKNLDERQRRLLKQWRNDAEDFVNSNNTVEMDNCRVKKM